MPEQRSGWAAKATYTERKNKVDVNYRVAPKCSTCDFFQTNKCERVDGNISPEAICQLFHTRSGFKYKDGQFYLDEVENKGKKKPVKVPKEGVHYRTMEKCDICDYYVNRKCKKVEGSISPETLCDMWDFRGFPTGGLDGDFYKGEYDKQVRRGLL